MNHFDINRLLESAFRESSEEGGVNIRALFEAKLEEYSIAKSKALSLLGIDKDVFEDIISGKAKQPNLIHVLKLAEFIEIPLQQAVSAILKEQSVEAIASLEKFRNTSFLLKHFDIKKLTQAGFLEKNADINQIAGRLLQFFGYKSVGEFELAQEAPLYSRTRKLFADKMMKFWVSAAYKVFEHVANPHEYDREAVKDIVSKVKPYTQDVNEGLFILCKALYHRGVTVIAQELLPTTQVRGGTFVVHNKPCIVITDYRKSYPTAWTTLMHELYHVLFDLDVIMEAKFHLTQEGQQDLFLIEEKADRFAMDYFCTMEEYNYIFRHIHSSFHVERFASQRQVHPAMIYNAYQYYQQKLHGQNYWAAFRNEIPKVQPALAKLNRVTWTEQSVIEIAVKLKEVFEIN